MLTSKDGKHRGQVEILVHVTDGTISVLDNGPGPEATNVHDLVRMFGTRGKSGRDVANRGVRHPRRVQDMLSGEISRAGKGIKGAADKLGAKARFFIFNRTSKGGKYGHCLEYPSVSDRLARGDGKIVVTSRHVIRGAAPAARIAETKGTRGAGGVGSGGIEARNMVLADIQDSVSCASEGFYQAHADATGVRADLLGCDKAVLWNHPEWHAVERQMARDPRGLAHKSKKYPGRKRPKLVGSNGGTPSTNREDAHDGDAAAPSEASRAQMWFVSFTQAVASSLVLYFIDLKWMMNRLEGFQNAALKKVSWNGSAGKARASSAGAAAQPPSAPGSTSAFSHYLEKMISSAAERGNAETALGDFASFVRQSQR